MPQIVIPAGQVVSVPGPLGSAPVMAFGDLGDPNLIADPMKLLANCALSSTFQRVDGPDVTHFLYVKTAGPTPSAPNGTWSNK